MSHHSPLPQPPLSHIHPISAHFSSFRIPIKLSPNPKLFSNYPPAIQHSEPKESKEDSGLHSTCIENSHSMKASIEDAMSSKRRGDCEKNDSKQQDEVGSEIYVEMDEQIEINERSFDFEEGQIQIGSKIIILMNQILQQNFSTDTLIEFQKIISSYITIDFIPQPLNSLGAKLLTSGKFIIAYYKTLLKGQNNPVLLEHIFNSIDTSLNITTHKNYLHLIRKFNEIKKQKYFEYLASQRNVKNNRESEDQKPSGGKSRKYRALESVKR